MSHSELDIEHWNPDLEQVVKNDGEQCQSLFWMHNEAANLNAKCNDRIQIPAIILASVTGFLSATSTLIPPVGIGAMALSVGILNTINSYYKFSQISEAHSLTAKLYFKAYKITETELALPIHQREHAITILQNLRDTMVRISEIAPPLPSSVVSKYNNTFKTSVVTKPIIAAGMVPITICVDKQDKVDLVNLTLPNTVDISSNTMEQWPTIKRQK